MSLRGDRDKYRQLLEEAELCLFRLLEKLGAWRLEARIWEAASPALRTEIKLARELYETHQLKLKTRTLWAEQDRQLEMKYEVVEQFLRELCFGQTRDVKTRAEKIAREFFPEALQHL